jgi:predicted nucleic-acid-binding Zn-ribbon protein
MSATTTPPWAELSESERVSRALAALHEKNAVRPCQRCGVNQWIGELLAIHSGALPLTGAGVTLGGYLPVISVSCSNCGYQVFHNLIVLGLVKR